MQRKNAIPKTAVKNRPLAPEVLDLIEILTDIAIRNSQRVVSLHDQKDDEIND
ncbi:MAG: hypothetical protein ABI351_13735 [Herbaspirillum sp.]